MFERPRLPIFLPAFLLLASLTGCAGNNINSSGNGGSSSPTPPSTSSAVNEWTWMSGSNSPYAAGVYGTQGVAAANNVPGARGYAVSWTDNSGDFWLFGGVGLDGNDSYGDLAMIPDVLPGQLRDTVPQLVENIYHIHTNPQFTH